MQIQFNFFGFEIQVKRPLRYSACVFVEGVEEPMVWSRKSSSLLLSRFLAWKVAREYAQLYLESVAFVIFEIDTEGHRITQRFNRTIVVTKAVQFFSR